MFSAHKWTVTRKMFPFDAVIMSPSAKNCNAFSFHAYKIWGQACCLLSYFPRELSIWMYARFSIIYRSTFIWIYLPIFIFMSVVVRHYCWALDVIIRLPLLPSKIWGSATRLTYIGSVFILPKPWKYQTAFTLPTRRIYCAVNKSLGMEHIVYPLFHITVTS